MPDPAQGGARPIYAIGDIHGMGDLLVKALSRISDHAGDRPYTVIFLGDYVDRGPQSAEVVETILHLLDHDPERYKAVKGNHEDMMATAVSNVVMGHEDGSDLKMWLKNGGQETLESYKANPQLNAPDHILSLMALPHLIETENHVFVHAGLKPGIPIADQHEMHTMWIRNWQQFEHDFGKHVVYGHSPSKTPRLMEHSTGLDVGACYRNELAVGIFDRDKKAGPDYVMLIS